jgi:hypothetical protein
MFGCFGKRADCLDLLRGRVAMVFVYGGLQECNLLRGVCECQCTCALVSVCPVCRVVAREQEYRAVLEQERELLKLVVAAMCKDSRLDRVNYTSQVLRDLWCVCGGGGIAQLSP